MFYVYILMGKRDGKIYTRYSSNLMQRVKQHLSGNVHTTQRMGEIQLIYYESFINKQDALKREKYLKTTKGKRALKLMLKFT